MASEPSKAKPSQPEPSRGNTTSATGCMHILSSRCLTSVFLPPPLRSMHNATRSEVDFTEFTVIEVGLNAVHPAPTSHSPTASTDEDRHPAAQFNFKNASDGGSASNAGAFFPRAKDFVVSDSTFTSYTHIHNPAPTIPPNFPTIPLGRLDLRNEIPFNAGSDTVYRRDRQVSVRKIYSARIHGCQSHMTVAVYDGDNAEEEWHREISKYAQLRHPNFLQLFGTVSLPGLWALIYHDEQYMHALSGTSLYYFDCTFWIRPSTGHLCVDLTPPLSEPFFISAIDRESRSLTSPFEPLPDSKIIALLSIDDYHTICWYHLSHPQFFSISSHASVKLGAIYRCPSGDRLDNAVETACIHGCGAHHSGWWLRAKRLAIMENGWTRVASCDAADIRISLEIWSTEGPRYWLTQANHIFNCLKITCNYEAYVLVTQIKCHLNIFGSKESTPAGYLFLCPWADLGLDIHGQFRLPECLSYWSTDPSGAKRLTTEGAKALRFPNIQLEMWAEGYSWDGSVYVGLHQFHQGKGFDPESQDLARHLGYPLLRLPGELDAPFSRFDVEDSDYDASGSEYLAAADDELDSKSEDIGALGIGKNGIWRYHISGKLLITALDSPLSRLSNSSGEEDETVNTQEQGNGLAVSIQDCGSLVHELTVEEPQGFNEVPPFSSGWQSFMWGKLALIVFLAGSWMYEHMYVCVAWEIV
ncbi:hypothetical protein K438DRAFT_1939713 [Mycena galopus ATCC 62051]|nr:hypothetical protein K438DRAFT_1939713 [Mycena galopus ATCC 62051]